MNMIRGWLERFRKYYFTYQNGFYHLPYNGKSPQTLIASIGNLPFVNHDAERQVVLTNIPFCEGGFHYRMIEDGCWLVYAKMHYKVNVAFDLEYRQATAKSKEPERFYMISLNHVSHQLKMDSSWGSENLVFPKNSWTFFKPRERNHDLNFKGSRNKYITLYVTEAWLQRNMLSNRLFEEARLNAFLKSDQPCIVWELTDDDSSMRYFNIFDKVLEVNDDIKPIDFFNLKLTTFNFLNEFLTSCKENQFFKEEQSISTLDGLQIQQVEHYLNNHLFHDFPGIEMLAAKFNLSETKLKTSFKNHFGKSVYQYFQTKKMHVAMELLQENELLVKEISYKLGYENTSKFSAVFKKHFGVLPSQIHAASKSVN